ncbi:MAG: TIGR02466 family protein [Pseudomonadota bacterium]|nr:TIGR02466 family protein [Pseudomonadota bacterium]
MNNQQQKETNASLRAIFATPVIEFLVPNADALNAKLKRIILKHEKSHKGTQHSNLGGWQSGWDMDQWGGDALDEIMKAAHDLASQATCDRIGKPAPVKWISNVWANVNRDGHGNEFHTHPGAYWSASYYVDDGGAADDRVEGGEFEIQDPRGVAPAMLAPHLAFAMPGGQSIGASELVRPRPGLMLLFPSWLSHAVRPYRGNGVRISIAINLTPVHG